MGFLVIALVLAGMLGGLAFRRSWRRERVERLRDRARLKVIEGQMAMLRTALRIGAAEHLSRRRMHEAYGTDVFANPTAQEEPEDWRS
jgi:hypothetical protein